MIFDKLAICNTALIRTGNTPAQFEGDGSDEWLTASDAYDTMLPVILSAHSWGFATPVVTLQRKGDSQHPLYQDAYYKPAGCLHVQAVWLNSSSVPYDIMDNLINLNAQSLSPTCKYVAEPAVDQWPPLFVEALRWQIMALIYSGLNEDSNSSMMADRKAQEILAEARSRTDQEKPAMALVVSRLATARSTRRYGSTFAGYGPYTRYK